jgi:uncharacterized membrane protein
MYIQEYARVVPVKYPLASAVVNLFCALTVHANSALHYGKQYPANDGRRINKKKKAGRVTTNFGERR